jgi:pSer/pThr/pTyr-binding forkhead associated (FHA) protein
MVQLNILSGKKAGTESVARRFPFQVGRSAQNGLVLDDAGVWDRHFTVDLQSADGVVLSTAPDALTTVNGNRVDQTLLRNGDVIEAGSVKLRFGLASTQQGSLRLRETLTWIGLAGLCLGQVALIYWLIS